MFQIKIYLFTVEYEGRYKSEYILSDSKWSTKVFLSIEKVWEAYDPLLLAPADSCVALWAP